jgi:hypothetical protein
MIEGEPDFKHKIYEELMGKSMPWVVASNMNSILH